MSWSIRDPFGEEEEEFLAVARTLEAKLHDLLEELGAAELSTP